MEAFLIVAAIAAACLSYMYWSAKRAAKREPVTKDALKETHMSNGGTGP